MEVVKAIEAVKVARGDKPETPVTIAKSGELEVPAEGIHKEL
jgi:peptidyl-prolyl cis-trans isomerase B (cyclophilin B)